MNKVIAIDPGTTESGYVVWNGVEIEAEDIIHNEIMIEMLEDWGDSNTTLVIEQIKSYGMPVSDSIFDIVFWAGRFCQAWPGEFRRFQDFRSSSIFAMIRRRMIQTSDLKGLKTHLWSAFALAVYYFERQNSI